MSNWPEIVTTEVIEKDVLDFVVDSFRKMFNLTDGKVTEVSFVLDFKHIIYSKYQYKEYYKANFICNKIHIIKIFEKKYICECTPDISTKNILIWFDTNKFKRHIRAQYLIQNYVGNYYFIFHTTAVNADKRKFVKDLLGENNFTTFGHYYDTTNLLLHKSIEVVKDVSINVYIENNHRIPSRLTIRKSGECSFFYGTYANKKMIQINIPDHMIAELNSLGMSKNSIKHSKAMKRMSRWTTGF